MTTKHNGEKVIKGRRIMRITRMGYAVQIGAKKIAKFVGFADNKR